MGSGCGSVGRAVASDTRGLRFKSSHWQKFIYIELLFTVNCVLKRQNKEKEARNGPFKKDMSYNQGDQIEILSVQYLTISSIENLTIGIENLPKYGKDNAKYKINH